MPDRLVRDELLRSHRYRTLSSDTARLLFIHLLLSVDNLGNFEADATAIGDVLRRPMDIATVAKLLSELADADLIRLYEVGEKRYLHVPRFRQRLRYLGSKHPRPPAKIECSEIKKLADEYGLKTGQRPAKAGRKPAEVKRSEEKKSNTHVEQKALDNAGFARFWAAWPASKRKVGRFKCLAIWNAKTLESLVETIVAHVVAMKATPQWHDEHFEPAPQTYLNQRRWEDGLPEAANAKSFAKVY